MSLFDKIKDALTKEDDKKAAQNSADQAATAAEEAERLRVQQQEEDEASKAADRDAAQRAADEEAARRAQAEQAERAAQRQADDERTAAEAEVSRRAEADRQAGEVKPTVSLGRVREVVAHDSSPDTPTGEGLDKGLGMLLESALRRGLDQAGLPNRNTDDGSLGTMFLESYSRWQGHLGYSGSDADGVPGWDSLQKLADATGMFAVVD